MAEGQERKRGQRVGFACFAVLVACGIGTLVGLRGTVHDLDRSLARFYDETEFADLVVVGGETDVFAAAARGVGAGVVLGTIGANRLIDAQT